MISNSIDSDSTVCPQCKSPIPTDAPGGICPGCVIDLGLSNAGNEEMAIDATIDMPKSSGPENAFIAPSAQDLNHLFDHLEIHSLLGQGGMGAVYKAKQISLDRSVAVKILPPYSGNDPTFQERFQREARALARLTHPNIVMVFEFGQISDMFYFVMEYVDGVNLREAIEAGGLTTSESLRVVPQICEALQFAHDEGIVHRDIKPENIILDSKGRIKIADFGLAKLMENNAINFTLTNTNQVLGTVKYMAPEQIENPNAVDHRSDIYSLGVVFYELLTGELPLGRFDPPSASYPRNQPLDPVVMRTLEKQPSNRFQNASEVKTAVESVVFGEVKDSADPRHQPKPGSREPNKEKGHRSSPRRTPAVNFQLKKVFGGFGRGTGLLRVDLDTEELILDMEIKDVLGGLFRSEFKQVRIAFDHVLAFQPEFSWYSSPGLEIQTDYFQEFATLPGAENGKLDLVFNTKDKKAAMAFCELVNSRLGFTLEEEPEPETDPVDETVNLEDLGQELTHPATGFWFAGLIDFISAAIALIVAVVMAGTGNRDLEVSLFASMIAVLFASYGFFQMYLSQSIRSIYGYAMVMAGSLAVSILWFHPGVLLAIPSTIWLAILIVNQRRRSGFRQSEREQTERPTERSDVYTDKTTQIELRRRFKWPIWILFSVGLMSLLFMIGSIVAFSEMGPIQSSNADRFRPVCVVFAASSFGVIALFGALILRFWPSIFWAKAMVRYSKFPVHILFPFSFFAGKSMQRQIIDYEQDHFSRNPYVQKGEHFTGLQ